MSDIGYKVNNKATDKFTLKDLGGCDCKDFCPAAATKKCARRSDDDPVKSSSSKGKLKSSRRRKLDPVTTAPQQATATTQIPTARAQLDPETLEQLEYIRTFFLQGVSEIHTVSRGPDGTLKDMTYTLPELEALIIAEAQPSSNIFSHQES